MKAEIIYKGSVIATLSEGQSMTLHCEGERLTDDIVVKAIADDIAPTLISFTIESKTYQAEAGMRWGGWLESAYNTAGYKWDGSYIVTSSGRQAVYTYNSSVDAIPNLESLIVDGVAYELTDRDNYAGGGGPGYGGV